MKALGNLILWISIFSLLGGSSSCSLSRSLKDGEYLLKKNQIVIIGEKRVKEKQQVKEDLKRVAVQKPNAKVFGFMPIKLWFFLAANKNKDTKFTWWIKNKVGEAPVIFDSLLASKSDKSIANYMNNYGYFDAKVRHEITYHKRKASVVFYVEPKKYWEIGRVLYPRPTYRTDSLVWQNHKKSILIKGSRFDIKNLKAERERIENDLKNSGYFLFNKDYVNFDLDTNDLDHVVNINVFVNQPSDSTQHQQYKINRIYTTTDFGTDPSGITLKRDTLKVLEYSFIYKKQKIKPSILLDGIFFKNGQLYQKDNYSRTLRRLNDFGTFKFVSIEFSKVDSNVNLLNPLINLTPAKRQTVGVDAQANVNLEGFFGVAGGITYKNRNLFNRADLLVVDLTTGIQFQFANKKPVQIITTQVGANISYYWNKFLFPFYTPKLKYQRPKTRFNINYNFEERYDFDANDNRVFFYDLHNFGAQFGYEWEPTTFMRHQVNPLVFNLYLIPKQGQEFIDRLNANESLKNTFQERIILGSSYSFTYTSQKTNTDKKYIYDRVGIESAGNLLMAGFSLANLKNTIKRPYTIANREFAEYFRIENDLRGFYRINANSSFAGRTFIGVAIPFGNSTTVPFIKQYFTGGPNSMRGFRVREVGPGAYSDPDYSLGDRRIGFFNQTGDIKIELNAELRFDIYKWFKGALFMDIGNVWLLNNDPQRPKGNFEFNRFWNEFAMNFGGGLRFDFNFFVIRFDYGVPFRDPRINSKNKWFISQGQFQLAVGYPF